MNIPMQFYSRVYCVLLKAAYVCMLWFQNEKISKKIYMTKE